MEIAPESALSSTGDPARHCPERGRGHTPSTTDSTILVYRQQLVHKILCLYLALTFFLCLPTSIFSAPAYHEQSHKIVNNEGHFQKNGQYYFEDAEKPVVGGNKAPVKKMSLIKEKLREKLSTREHDRINIKAMPFTFKAEISLEWKDMKDFFRGLVKGSSTTSREIGDTRSHRSARDTEPEMSAAESGDGPWISNLSPAAVVGTIVGGTIGIFVIVVLTVIICSYKNYSSLEMRQRTSDVYGGGNGYRQAERRM